MIEVARRWAELDVEPGARPRPALLPARGAARPEQARCPALFDSARGSHEAELAILPRADRQHDPARLPRQPERADRLPRRQRRTRRGPGWPRTRSRRRSKGWRRIAAIEPRPVEIGGLTFTEVASITQIQGGIATNVIPDRASANVNFRYAPDRSPVQRRRLSAEPACRRARPTRTPATLPRPASSRTRRSSSGCAPPATSRSSRSRPGRTSPTSRRAASTRSTSAPARPATPTAATSRWRSRALERAFESLWSFLTGTV